MSSKWLIFFICIILINDLTPAPIRIKRSKGQRVADIAQRAASKVWRASKKVFIYTIILVGGTVVGNEVLKKVDEWSGPVYLERVQVNCKANNYGCAEKLCWANCGPRMRANDWCFTGPPKEFQGKLMFTTLKDNHTQKETSFTYIVCEKDSDCNPCWGCAGSCMLGSDAVMQPDGTIDNSD